MTTPRRPKIDVPFTDDAEVHEMVRLFEACRWPYSRWTHRAHLGVALCYLQERPFDEALSRVRHHIQLYNRTCGDPTGYHETLTVLFLRRVAAYLRDVGEPPSLAEAVELLAAEYDMAWPLRYYSAELLWSARAREEWTDPDLRELDF